MPSPLTPAEQRRLAAAFYAHARAFHGADFEVCRDPECLAVRSLDKRLFADEGDDSPYAERWQAEHWQMGRYTP